MEETFYIQVTKDKMEYFKEITGDVNPLHTDSEYAKRKGFEDKVVYGFLTASVLSALAGMYLPGKYSLIQEAAIKLVNPVFINDELKVCGKVTGWNETMRQIEIKCTIFNQHSEKVLRGKMKVGLL